MGRAVTSTKCSWRVGGASVEVLSAAPRKAEKNEADVAAKKKTIGAGRFKVFLADESFWQMHLILIFLRALAVCMQNLTRQLRGRILCKARSERGTYRNGDA